MKLEALPNLPTKCLPLKVTDQIMRRYIQCTCNFHKRIHRGRFYAALDTAYENGGKSGFFCQSFLTQAGAFACFANRFTQKAAMFEGRHSLSGNSKADRPAMSLTPSFACKSFGLMIKTENSSGGVEANQNIGSRAKIFERNARVQRIVMGWS